MKILSQKITVILIVVVIFSGCCMSDYSSSKNSEINIEDNSGDESTDIYNNESYLPTYQINDALLLQENNDRVICVPPIAEWNDTNVSAEFEWPNSSNIIQQEKILHEQQALRITDLYDEDSLMYKSMKRVFGKTDDEYIPLYNWVPPINNDISLKEICTNQILPMQEAVLSPGDGYVISSYTPIFESYAKYNGLYTLRQSDKNTFYTVYRVIDGGYLYVFFSNVAFDNTGLNSTFVEINSIYLSKTLSYDDFSDINIGDNIKQVSHIDPFVKRIENCFEHYQISEKHIGDNFEHYITYIGTGEAISIHLLTDGLLTIKYRLDDSGKIIVSEKIYSPDFSYPYTIYTDTSITTPLGIWDHNMIYKILPQDYPPAS